MSGLEIAGAVLTGLSTISSIQGASRQAAAIKAAGQNQPIVANYQAKLAERQGVAQKQEADYVAAQRRTQAGQERASAQRGAIEQTRRGKLAESAAIAKGAAGGGSVGDFYSTIAGIGAESEYARLASLFEGEDAARGLESQAALDVYGGDEAVRAAKHTAAGYRAGGTMAVGAANTNAATARREGYQSALSTVGSSLMSKYSPSSSGYDPISWNPEPYGPYRTKRI